MSQSFDHELKGLVDALLHSYRTDARGHHINRKYLPSRTEIIDILHLLLQVLYPGYVGRQGLTDEEVSYHVGVILSTLREKLARQVEQCLCHQAESEKITGAETSCAPHAKKVASAFLAKLPELRATLLDDVQAAFDGDPAATTID
ncbi:MAG TPA: serine acetyltransferase, partial [Polyangiaceae bacterium]